MNTLEINDKEKQLRNEATSMIESAKIEGRKLTEDEDARFKAIQSELAEVKETRRALDEQLKSLNKEAASEIRKENINKLTNMSENKEFRLLDQINAVVNNRTIDDASLEVIKKGQEQMKRSGLSYSGQIQMPINTRALNGVVTASNVYTANTYNGGKEAVATDTLDIVGPLYGNLGLVSAGATFMTGLEGDIEIPTMGATTVGWKGELDAADNGTPTFGSKTMAPKKLTTYVDISKQFLIQTSDSAESMIRQDIVNALSAEIERTLLKTAVTSNAPAPLATTAIDLKPTASATIADNWYGLVASLEDANFYGDFNVVISPQLKKKLRGAKLDAGSGKFLFEDGTLDGYTTYVSSNVFNDSANANAGALGYIGVFPEVLVGLWGGVDIVVDPYSQAVNGKVRIVASIYVDAIVRRDGAIKAFKCSALSA